MDKRILVVDDEEPMRKIVGRTLSQEGYQVELASGGEEALKLMKNNPDLVILDIKMPGMDGFQVLDLIREESTIPVIMLSGLGQVTTISEALSAGADDFLAKPFRMNELLARVKAKLRQAERS